MKIWDVHYSPICYDGSASVQVFICRVSAEDGHEAIQKVGNLHPDCWVFFARRVDD